MPRKLAWTIPLLVIGTHVGFLGTTAADGGAEQILNVSQTYHDLGNVDHATLIEGEVAITNISADAVEFADVRYSCGCTAAKFDRQTMLPGDVGTLSYRIDTAQSGGGLNEAQIYLIFVQGENSLRLSPIAIRYNVINARQSSTQPIWSPRKLSVSCTSTPGECLKRVLDIRAEGFRELEVDSPIGVSLSRVVHVKGHYYILLDILPDQLLPGGSISLSIDGESHSVEVACEEATTD